MSIETAVAAATITAISWRILRRTRRRRLNTHYRAYIQSSEWQRKARRWKQDADWRCEQCQRYPVNRRDLHAHHKHYRTFGREQRADVAILCGRCHRKRHRRKGWRR